MSNQTKIDWVRNADGSQGATWNCVRGCSKVSQGCAQCFALRMAARFSERWALPPIPPLPGVEDDDDLRRFAEMREGKPHWTGRVELIPEKLEEPLHWKKPRTIFVNSMSDLFHESLPDEAIDKVFSVMALCPQHRFMILTKRAKRMLDYMLDVGLSDVSCAADDIREHIGASSTLGYDSDPFFQDVVKRFNGVDQWPLNNVLLGVSCENQATADERIPLLLRTPAAKRFVSIEPILGPITARWARWVDYERTINEKGSINEYEGLRKLSLVIVGAESGPHRRPADIAWLRSLRDQCVAAGTPYFLKQMDVNGKLVKMPELDGKVWDQMPE